MVKKNEATLNRPEGDRIIDAHYVHMDLEEFARQLKEEPAWQKNDRNGITIFKTDNLTIVLVALHKAAEIKDNSVSGIISIQVIQGRVGVEFIDGEIELREKQMMNFHPFIKHSIKAQEESLLLMTNYTR